MSRCPRRSPRCAPSSRTRRARSSGSGSSTSRSRSPRSQGIDIAVPGLTLTTENLDTDLAVVTATGGTADATFDPASFPLGSIVREVFGDELAASELSQPLAGTDPSVMLATVARDGRWYVSLGFTVAEYARVAAGAEFPPPAAIERVGWTRQRPRRWRSTSGWPRSTSKARSR